MMKDWKVIAVFSGGAFILSSFAGIIGGVSFAGILMRALAGGLVFGLLAFLLSLVLRTYLPEIYGKGDVPAEPPAAEPGSGVDIVIDDRENGENSSSDDDLETEVSEEMPVIQEDYAAKVVDDDVSVLSEEGDHDQNGLPNIEEFSEVFNNTVENMEEKSSLTGSVSVDIMGQEQDPGTVAKAIRTIMKKDQEG